jgi:hypothetical protein
VKAQRAVKEGEEFHYCSTVCFKKALVVKLYFVSESTYICKVFIIPLKQFIISVGYFKKHPQANYGGFH